MKKLLLIMLVLFITGLAFADTVQVGTGTSTSSYLPLYGLYGYNYTQQIYTQAQIGVAGNITKIRFYYVSGTITNSKDWVVYMGHTTKTTFATTTDWEPLANLTQVFAGDVTSLVPLANNWMEITLSTPFAYNNTDNLIVAVDENTAGYASMSWGAFTSGTNTGIYYYSDTINPDPAAPPTASSRTATIDRMQFVFPNSAAPLAPTLLTPANGGWSFLDGKLYWTPTAGGSDANTYDVYFGTSATPPLVSDNQVATNYTPTLAANTTYWWKVTAANEIGDSPASATWSFMTPGATQLAESFENTTFPPAGWARITSNTSYWGRSTSQYKHGVASMNVYTSTTTPYSISTPKLTIVNGSKLNFWTFAGATSQKLQILYSTDRTSWTQLGSDITYAAASTWYNIDLDLTSLAGGNYYLAFNSPTQTTGYQYIYVDLVIGPSVTPEAPGPVTLSLPADAAINVSEYPTFTWTAPVTGGAPTGYAVYCSTTNPPNYTTDLIGSTGAGVLTFTATTALAYNTTYYWTVKAFNAAGDATMPTPRSFTTRANPTISTFPWEVNFGTLAADWPVLNWSQLNGLYGSALTTGTQWFQDDFANVTTPLNKSAKINIYGTTRNGWLVTPPIAIPASGYELKFDIAFTDYGATVPPVAGEQADDKFIVFIDDNPNMSSPTILREWNNTGSPYVYDNVSNTGENHIIDLDDYTGTVYFAFYGESSVSNGDNDFFVDNVIVRETPSVGILQVSPNPVECGNSFIGYLKNVTVTLSNIGGAPFNLSTIALSNTTNFSLSGLPTLPYTLGVGLSVPITVGFTPTVAGALTTNLLINDTRINSSIVVNGTGVVMPVGEICENPYIITTSPTAYSTNNVGFSNDYISTMFTGVTSSSYLNGLDWVAKLVLPSAKQVNINVADQAGYTYQYLGVYLVGSIPSLASPAAVLGQATAGSGTVTIPTITLAAGTYYIIVDNWPSPVNTYFTLNVTYTDPTPPLPATLVSPTPSGTTGVANTATLNWANGGGGPTGYKLQYGTNAAADNLMSLTDILNVTTYDPAGVFTYGQTYYWKVVPYNGAGTAVIADCPVWSFTVMADPSISSFPYIENFDAVTTPALPTGWTVGEGAAGASYHWKTTTTATHGPAAANSPSNFAWLYCFLASTTYNPYSLITPPIALPVTPKRLAYYYWIGDDTYENPLFVDISTDNMANWTTLYTHSNLTNTLAWYQNTVDLTDYASQTVYLRFRGVSNYASSMTDFGIDDVLISDFPSGAPEAVTLTSPADGATGLPIDGFDITWTPALTGGVPTYYAVFMSQDETTIYDDLYWETTNTSFNPVTDGGVTFDYLDRWYYTVQAFNDDGDALVDPPYWFEIQSDPTVALPYAQDFGTATTWPLNWTQSSTGSNIWTVSATANAGGTASEMKGSWESLNGITRLISAPINTTGISAFAVGFNTLYDDYGVGITAKLQYSNDLTTWTDSPWSIVSGSGNVSGYQTVIINGIAAPMTYVAWVLDGNHFQFDYWYVDDVAMSLPPEHDVSPISWDVPVEVVPENTLVTPMVTVGNNGLNTESFDVTCTIGTYTNTQTVAGLAAGQTLQVSFSALTPALWSANNVVVTTNLTTDMVAANDTLFAVLICLDLNTNALASNAQTDEYVQFNLSDPSTLTVLPNGYTGSYFMSGADWMNGTWKTVEYDDGTLTTDNYYQIDPITGLSTNLGEPGQAFMGIAYNDNSGVLYGIASTGFLHTMDPLTGLAGTGSSLWYNLSGTPTNITDIGGLMIDIAYDNFTNTMYGIDLGNDCLWVINPATYELTLVGFFGIDINYAQDAAFDQNNGLLFLAGYSSFGGLYWIDTTYGGAYLVGPLGPNANEFDAFAIPYGEFAAAPQVSISGAGLVSWTPVPGAIQYNVYSCDDPYGNFALEASVIGTEYTGIAAAHKFYRVTAVGGRSNINRQPISYSSPLLKNAPEKNNKPNHTNIVR